MPANGSPEPTSDTVANLWETGIDPYFELPPEERRAAAEGPSLHEVLSFIARASREEQIFVRKVDMRRREELRLSLADAGDA